MLMRRSRVADPRPVSCPDIFEKEKSEKAKLTDLVYLNGHDLYFLSWLSAFIWVPYAWAWDKRLNEAKSRQCETEFSTLHTRVYAIV